MRFKIGRVFLVSREPPPLLVELRLVPEPTTRAEYLHKAFEEPRLEFVHRKRPFTYVHVETVGDIIVGRIGRAITVKSHEGPGTKYAPAKLPTWEASLVFIETNGSPDGQKVAIEDQSQVGKPIAIFQSLVHHINVINPDSGWEIVANAISDDADFWVAAAKHRGHITDLEFVFVAPNIFGSESETEVAVRMLKAMNGAQQVRVALHNEQGLLEPDTQLVRDHVDYVTRGGGAAKLKVGKSTVFDTEEHALSIPVPNAVAEPAETDELPTVAGDSGDAGLVRRLIRWLFSRA